VAEACAVFSNLGCYLHLPLGENDTACTREREMTVLPPVNKSLHILVMSWDSRHSIAPTSVHAQEGVAPTAVHTQEGIAPTAVHDRKGIKLTEGH